MIYKADRFDNVYQIKNFLNENEIKPTDIVGIFTNHNYQGQVVFDLLYVEQAESEVRICKMN